LLVYELAMPTFAKLRFARSLQSQYIVLAFHQPVQTSLHVCENLERCIARC